MVPEWLAVLAAATMYAMGFLTCGSFIGKGAFWDGVRYVWFFEFINDIVRRKD